MSGRFVLLGGGDIRDYDAVLGRIHPGDFIICADSGYDHCRRMGLAPNLLVGDFDSVRADLPEQVPTRLLDPVKNYTDTTHAIEEALNRGCRELLLSGMLGGRLDHTLANLQSLANLSRQGIRACVTDGVTDCYAVTDGALVLPCRERCYFSVMSYTEVSTGVFIRNAKYPLVNYTLYFDIPRGVSNEFLEGNAEISVKSGTLVVLSVPFDHT